MIGLERNVAKMLQKSCKSVSQSAKAKISDEVFMKMSTRKLGKRHTIIASYAHR